MGSEMRRLSWAEGRRGCDADSCSSCLVADIVLVKAQKGFLETSSSKKCCGVSDDCSDKYGGNGVVERWGYPDKHCLHGEDPI